MPPSPVPGESYWVYPPSSQEIVLKFQKRFYHRVREMDFGSSRLKQMKNLVLTLTRKNYESQKKKIYDIITPEFYQELVGFTIENMDFNIRSEKDQCICALLKDVISWMKDAPNFSPLIVGMFENTLRQKTELINFLMKEIFVTVDLQVALALAFYSSESLRSHGVKIIQSTLEYILKDYVHRRNDLIPKRFAAFISRAPEFEDASRGILETLGYTENEGVVNPRFNKGPVKPSTSFSFVRVLDELGYYAFSSVKVAKAVVLKLLPKFSEYDCSRIVTYMSTTRAKLINLTNESIRRFLISVKRNDLLGELKEMKTWSIDIFVETVWELRPEMDFGKVIKCLDHPGFRAEDPHSFMFIVSFWRTATKGAVFPVELFLEREWVNADGQISMLFYCLHQQLPELTAYEFEKIETGKMKLHPNVRKHTAWNNMVLIRMLLRLDNEKTTQLVRKVFEYPLKHLKSLLLLGLLQAKNTGSILRDEMISFLLFYFIRSPKLNYGIITHVARSGDHELKLVLNHLRRAYLKDSRYLGKIIELVEEDEIILKIINLGPTYLSLVVAIKCHRRHLMDLGSFITREIKRRGEHFVKECLSFLGAVIFNNKDYGIGKKISNGEYGIIFQVLGGAVSDKESKTSLDMMISHLNIETGGEDNMLEGVTYRISELADQWANQFMESVFNGKVSLEQAIETMRDLHDVDDTECQEKYAAAIHNLLDEFRFFDQYPPTQLNVVAAFFGEVINQDLVQGSSLNIALVCVVRALLNHPTSQLFRFGKIALGRFKLRARGWPSFLGILGGNPAALKEFPELFQKSEEILGNFSIEKLENEKISSPPTELVSSPPVNVQSKSGFYVNIKTLTKFAQSYNALKPKEKMLKRYKFILNNLSSENISLKVNEFREIFDRKYLSYFGLTLVINRVSVEVNNHYLYFGFVMACESEEFVEVILRITYGAIKKLFNSDKIRNDFNERSLFKNLGAWLGLFTLGRNRPILKRDLELKNLLFSAYQNGKLIAVVPFVCKILNSVKNSMIFVPPNPWTHGILSVLVEIHQIEKLKMNIKFDVEMIFKLLEIRLHDVEIKNYLKDIQMSIHPGNNPDIKAKPVSTLGKKFDISKITLPAVQYTELNDKVIISKGIRIFDDHPGLRKVVVVALDQALKEIIAPVVKRSVTIACRTTLDLVTKDFHAEKDEKKLNQAANLMVQNLATNLAIVTCKNPLISSMESRLRGYLNSMCIVEMDDEMRRRIIEAARRVTHENVHVGCVYVNKLAIEKAKHDMTVALKHEIGQRMKYRESDGRIPFSLYPQVFTEELKNAPALPMELFPQDGIGELQKNLYQDFGGLMKDINEKSQKTTSYQKKLGEIETHVQLISDKIESGKFSEKRIGIEFRKVEERIINLVQSTPNIFEFSGDVIRNLLSRYYVTKHTLFKDILIHIMKAIQKIEGNQHLSDTIFVGWVSTESERKFSKDSVTLVLSGILPLVRFDMEVAKNITQNSQEAFLFAFKIIEETMVDNNVLDPKDMPRTIAILGQRFRHMPRKYQEILKRVVNPFIVSRKSYDHGHPVIGVVNPNEDFRVQKVAKDGKKRGSAPQTAMTLKMTPRRKVLLSKFQQWMKIYESVVNRNEFDGKRPNSIKGEEKERRGNSLLSEFVIKELQRGGYLETDNDFINICRVLTHYSIQHYHSFIGRDEKDRENEKNKKTQNKIFYRAREHVKRIASFQMIDSFTGLITIILRISTFDNKVVLLGQCLTVVGDYLIKEHDIEVSKKFHQIPYLRIFSNLLVSLDKEKDPKQILISKFSKVFESIEPNKCPAFLFGWIDLISHRYYIRKLLISKNSKVYEDYHNLIIKLFKFVYPFFAKAQLTPSVKQVYKSILRILLVLLHDFSEFLCVYHFSLIDAIPPNCIQVRNLILSAFPRSMKLPDPFTPNLKVDLLPEIKQSPKILSNYTKILEATNLKTKIESYLKNINNENEPLLRLVEEIMKRFIIKTSDGKTKYESSLINSVVLHIGVETTKIPKFKQRSLNKLYQIVQKNGMEFFSYMSRVLDYEGRYIFYNSLANQLRYPNNQTHYYSFIILTLFEKVRLENGDEIVQAQLTRVLLERLIVNRPHPWGLLITFIELVKNKEFGFWDMKFIHCAPSIERLFANVGRSCLRGNNPRDQN